MSPPLGVVCYQSAPAPFEVVDGKTAVDLSQSRIGPCPCHQKGRVKLGAEAVASTAFPIV